MIITSIRGDRNGPVLEAYFMFELPQTGDKIAFRGTDIKFSHDGALTGTGRMELIGSYHIKLNDKTLLTILGKGNTYVEFDWIIPGQGIYQIHCTLKLNSLFNNNKPFKKNTYEKNNCFALMISLTVTISCKEDDEKTQTDFLTEKSWAISMAEMQYDEYNFDVSTEFIRDCEKDNTITFTRDGKYSEEVGTADCDGDEATETGTWEWKDGEKTLHTIIGGTAEDWKVLTLNSTTLNVNVGTMMYDTDQDGIYDTNVSVIYTLTSK